MTRNSRFSAFALVVFAAEFLVPVAIAAGCSIRALDTVAGLGTEVSASGCSSGSSVMSITGPASMEYSQSLVVDENGAPTTIIPSKYTLTAGTYFVRMAEASSSFVVFADRADDGHSTLIASPKSVRPGETVTVTGVLRDRYDNPVSDRPIALMSSRGSDEVESLSGQTDDEGRIVWKVRAAQSGLMTLIPYDIIGSKQLKLRADVTVSGNTSVASLMSFTGGDADMGAELTSTEVDHFELTLPQDITDVKANELFGMTIRAMRSDALVRGYVGTLIVESTDPDAELPKKGEDPKSPKTGRIDIRSVDQGERKLSLIFVLRKSGPQTIRVYDKSDPNMKGEITLNVLRGEDDGDGHIVIVDPPDRSRVKGHSVLLQGRAPSLVNLIVKGGKQTVNAESDEEGVFRVSVELNPEDKEATLFVMSENGTYESAPLHIIVDTDAPTIETIVIDPAEGKTEDPATITVKSEPGMATVTALLGAKETPLAATGSGYYKGTVTAPKQEGIYDVIVKVTDTVGNHSSLLTKWTVKPKLLPIVTGLKAESQTLKVALSWNAIETVPVREYKIYIADESDPGNYLYSIGTQKAVVSAVMTDLPLGRTYQFSLTAITADGQESPEKSVSASAAPLGMKLTATSGDASLFLEWNRAPDLTLSHYLLEFGSPTVGDDTMRTGVNGEAISFVLADLLDGTQYELRLTPVDITGKIHPELAAVTRGTPGGDGFHPGADDPAPPDILNDLHPGADLSPPIIDTIPRTPGSGISSMMMALLLVGAAAGGLLWFRERRQYRLTQEFLQSMHQRYHS